MKNLDELLAKMETSAPHHKALHLYLRHLNSALKRLGPEASKDPAGGYLHSWALIEQIMLPGLIRFIASKHKLTMPKNLFKSNVAVLNLFYFAVSHDEELFNALEIGRKNRNRLTHDVFRGRGIVSLRKEYKKATKHNVLTVMELLHDRFGGKTVVPSLMLYAKGWNDATERCVSILKKHFGLR